MNWLSKLPTLFGYVQRYIIPGLLGVIAILWTYGYIQHVQNGILSAKLAACNESQRSAAHESKAVADAITPQIEATYEAANHADAPAVDRVVWRTRNICVQQPAKGHLPVPATAGQSGPTGGKAADDADRAAWLSAVASDLKTCQSELNRLDAIRNFHNALVSHR